MYYFFSFLVDTRWGDYIARHTTQVHSQAFCFTFYRRTIGGRSARGRGDDSDGTTNLACLGGADCAAGGRGFDDGGVDGAPEAEATGCDSAWDFMNFKNATACCNSLEEGIAGVSDQVGETPSLRGGSPPAAGLGVGSSSTSKGTTTELTELPSPAATSPVVAGG